MKVGYARVSTLDQSLDLQLDALHQAGCDRIFQDVVSGAKVSRPGLDEALDYLRSGDTLVVWRLDRLGRSLPHLIQSVKALEERGIGFHTLQESINTSTSGGKLIFHIFGALAEFERNLIQERTEAGLLAARARGRNVEVALGVLMKRRCSYYTNCMTKSSIPFLSFVICWGFLKRLCMTI